MKLLINLFFIHCISCISNSRDNIKLIKIGGAVLITGGALFGIYKYNNNNNNNNPKNTTNNKTLKDREVSHIHLQESNTDKNNNPVKGENKIPIKKNNKEESLDTTDNNNPKNTTNNKTLNSSNSNLEQTKKNNPSIIMERIADEFDKSYNNSELIHNLIADNISNLLKDKISDNYFNHFNNLTDEWNNYISYNNIKDILEQLKTEEAEKEASKADILLDINEDIYNELLDNREFQKYNQTLDIYFFINCSSIGKKLNIYNNGKTFNKIPNNLQEKIIAILDDVTMFWYRSNNKKIPCYFSVEVDDDMTKEAISYANEFIRLYTNIKARILPKNNQIINKKKNAKLDIDMLKTLQKSPFFKNTYIKKLIDENPYDNNKIFYYNSCRGCKTKTDILEKIRNHVSEGKDFFLDLDEKTLESLTKTIKFKNYEKQINIYKVIHFLWEDSNNPIHDKNKHCIGKELKENISLEDEIIYILNTIVEFLEKNHKNFILPYCFSISYIVNNNHNNVGQTIKAIYYANELLKKTPIPIIFKADYE